MRRTERAILGVVFFAALGTIAGADPRVERARATPAVFDFSDGNQGWTGGFADYPVGAEEFYELGFEHRQLPEELPRTGSGLFLTGNNHSDDLFMYATTAISGLRADTRYRVRGRVRVASNAPRRATGVGGAPGEGVVFLLGASAEEPAPVVDDAGMYRMNLANGSGRITEGARVLGHVGVRTSMAEPEYRFKTFRVGRRRIFARTNEDGVLWLFAGTDSGFEATTAIYIDSVRLRLVPLTRARARMGAD